jgi:hypothetical protein
MQKAVIALSGAANEAANNMSGVVDVERQRIHRVGRVNSAERACDLYKTVSDALVVTVVADDVAGVIDPPREGSGGAWNINGIEHAARSDKAMAR